MPGCLAVPAANRFGDRQPVAECARRRSSFTTEERVAARHDIEQAVEAGALHSAQGQVTGAAAQLVLPIDLDVKRIAAPGGAYCLGLWDTCPAHDTKT